MIGIRMFISLYLLLFFIDKFSGMRVCNCTACMGLVEGLHRNTIANHRQKKRGIASPANIVRAKRLRDGVLSPSNDDDDSRGGRDGQTSDEDWEQDEDSEDENGQQEYVHFGRTQLGRRSFLSRTSAVRENRCQE